MVRMARKLGLAVAILLPVLTMATMPGEIVERIHYLYLAIAVGSGALAHAKAGQNDK